MTKFSGSLVVGVEIAADDLEEASERFEQLAEFVRDRAPALSDGQTVQILTVDARDLRKAA